jgi:predicted dehydrogenase
MDHAKIGVIGAGRMGKNHCRIYASLRRAELAGVCDQDMELGRQVARQFQVPFYPTLDELFEHVDAVSVVTPTPSHFDLAMRCLEKRTSSINYVLKPIA